MHSPPSTIATRGILNNKSIVLPVAGWLILAVEVRKRGGSPPNVPLWYPRNEERYYPKHEEEKYEIKVTLQYKDKIYTDIQYIKENINITKKDIDVEIIDDKPIVTINFLK